MKDKWPSDEELGMVKNYVLLPLLLTVLQRDMRIIEASEITIKTPYLEWLQGVLDNVTKELAFIKNEFRIRGIKVYEQQRTKKEIDSKYVCRGYYSSFNMLWDHIKAEIEIRKSHFFKKGY